MSPDHNYELGPLIRISHGRNRFLTAAETARTHNRSLHEQAVRRHLREAGIRSRHPNFSPILTLRHRQAILDWAGAHVRWPRQTWALVLFTDESKFEISYADSRHRVYRRCGKCFAQCCVA